MILTVNLTWFFPMLILANVISHTLSLGVPQGVLRDVWLGIQVSLFTTRNENALYIRMSRTKKCKKCLITLFFTTKTSISWIPLLFFLAHHLEHPVTFWSNVFFLCCQIWWQWSKRENREYKHCYYILDLCKSVKPNK